MSLFVQKAGVMDSFQDPGRNKYRRFGINPNGAMDRTALRVANLLLENKENEAAIEMHFPAPRLEFRMKTSFALTGADFGAVLDESPLQTGKAVIAESGSVLSFKKRVTGNRCYLSVRNGFELEEWLDSESTNLAAGISGFSGRSLKKEDLIEFTSPENVPDGISGRAVFGASADNRFRFIPAPAFRDLTAGSELAFLRTAFKITGESNRMGFRLDGSPLHLLDDSERLSSAVTYGTIQLLPGGQLIVLMADHQTTGGYPNLGTIIAADLSRAGQLGSGDEITFAPVDIKTAENALFDLEQDFAFFKTGLRLGRKLL